VDQRIRLGRVAGIGVAAHWSVVVIVMLLGWSLAAFTLPDAAPGYAEVWYWVGGLTAVVVFFAALLAHELAHSVVARNRGVAVEDITLWLFGGVSRLKGEPRSPRDELSIAVAGPVASFAIAVGFATIGLGVSAINGPPLATATLLWLALINGILGLFNLAPAAPLDGGRVLHALMWHRTGDRAGATAVATRAGQRFGFVLVGAGILLFLLGDLAALWFVFLGWFLLTASRAEATGELLRGALAHLRARDVMSSPVVVVPESIPLDRLVDDWFLAQHCSAFPIVDAAGSVQGLVTLRRVRQIRPAARSGLRASDAADPVTAIATCEPDDLLPEVLERVAGVRGGAGRVLVFEDGSLAGIISPTDVQRALDISPLRGARRDAPDDPEAADNAAASHLHERNVDAGSVR
jgi:Zn-dependent protease